LTKRHLNSCPTKKIVNSKSAEKERIEAKVSQNNHEQKNELSPFQSRTLKHAERSETKNLNIKKKKTKIEKKIIS